MMNDEDNPQTEALETPWHPIGATYVRGRWRILFARYGPDGWEFSERVESELPTMLRSKRDVDS